MINYNKDLIIKLIHHCYNCCKEIGIIIAICISYVFQTLTLSVEASSQVFAILFIRNIHAIPRANEDLHVTPAVQPSYIIVKIHTNITCDNITQ